MRVAKLLLWTFLVAGCADATAPSDSGGDSVGDSAGESTAERLLAAPPPGWQRTYEMDADDIRLVEFMPEPGPSDTEDGAEDEDEEDAWTDKISFESFTAADLPDPIVLQDSIARDRKQACSSFDDFNTYAGYENNYPTVVRLFLCHRDKASGRGEITMLKTIQGNDAFYVIQRRRRVDPFPGLNAAPMRNEEMGLWSLYFRSISVCDERRLEHPCPKSSDTTT